MTDQEEQNIFKMPGVFGDAAPPVPLETMEDLKADFNTAYQDFLRKKHVSDHPVVKAGFFTVLEKVVIGDPHPHPTLQGETLAYIREVIGNLADDLLQDVDQVVWRATKNSASKREAWKVR